MTRATSNASGGGGGRRTTAKRLSAAALTLCGALGVAAPAAAAPSARTTVTIRAQGVDLSGYVSSTNARRCANERAITVYRQKGRRQSPRSDTRVASDNASPNGRRYQWSTGNTGLSGRFYARARAIRGCRADSSPTIIAKRQAELSVESAAVGPITSRLSISKNFQRYNVNLTGVVRMPQAEAQALLNSGHRIQWRLWGEDPVSDDLRFGPDPPSKQPVATAQGIEFEGTRITSLGVLDEDDSVFDDRDELYIGVRLVNAGGGTVKSGESNRFRRTFED